MRKAMLALAAALGLLIAGASTASADGTLTGDIPGHDVPGGVAIVQWTGGPIEELQAAADLAECRLRSAWITSEGAFVGYVVGAPEFVNDEWTATVGATVDARTLLIVCYTPGLDDSCTASSSVLDYGDITGTDTPREALDRGLQSFSEFPDAAPPPETFVQVSISDATPEAPPTALFELIAYDGVVVGRFSVVDYGGGWLLSSTTTCYFAGAS
jgi:hypothetical protein